MLLILRRRPVGKHIVNLIGRRPRRHHDPTFSESPFFTPGFDNIWYNANLPARISCSSDCLRVERKRCSWSLRGRWNLLVCVGGQDYEQHIIDCDDHVHIMLTGMQCILKTCHSSCHWEDRTKYRTGGRSGESCVEMIWDRSRRIHSEWCDLFLVPSFRPLKRARLEGTRVGNWIAWHITYPGWRLLFESTGFKPWEGG